VTAPPLHHAASGPPGAPGPPLVLVHGAGGTLAHWPRALRELAGRRVVALDLPGHGASPPPAAASIRDAARAVLDLADALGVARFVAAGHSMGGAIALALALEHPDRIAGLVLVGTGARLRVAPAVLEATASGPVSADAAAAIAASSFGAGAPAPLVAGYARDLAGTAPGVLHGDLAACDRFDAMDRLAAIACPALVACGDEDRLTPPKYARYLAEGIPGARLVVLAGAGHLAPLERPDACAAAVAAWLDAAFPA
jgi:pimeloyl-ACP methyl ester carboxylesterase